MPQVLDRQIQIAAVVGTQRLANAPKEKGSSRKLPKKPPENKRPPHSLQAGDENRHAHQQLQEIGQNWSRP
jgi:hypothetical protein